MTAINSTDITPFTIDIPQEAFDDLQRRLRDARLANSVPGSDDRYGTPAAYVEEMLAYWRDSYDWRAWEARLNRYPQFMTTIDGQSIHFFHIRSQVEGATPLVLLHGWPGSAVEFLEVIEPLIDPVSHGGAEEDAFHLVIPAMPGFGFSGPTQDGGWTTKRTALAVAELMRRLGYERYGTQGGDFGAFVGPSLGRVDQEHVIGVHVNAATYGFIPYGDVSEEESATLTEGEQVRLARMQNWWQNLAGYFHMQSTRPQTLAWGISDSPVGLLGWIGDWFYRSPGIDRDRVLTNIMLYWLTNTFASSIRVYYEDMHSGEWPEFSTTPTGVANFGDDIAIRRYADQMNTIVHWTEFDEGGHFAAMDVPGLLVEDVRAFYRLLRQSA
ncbi:MAG: epoxide hydrolase [Thermomicrobiales bacterium]|jgi:pimeloyl-ACP methyl ester carboxylesterase|nr:epoxide hydrolase [Thermomicrobiales bacterium]